MGKIRVHELAKKLNISSKELIEELKSRGVSVESHMNQIDSEQADEIENSLKANKKEEKPYKKFTPSNNAQGERRNKTKQNDRKKDGRYDKPFNKERRSDNKPEGRDKRFDKPEGKDRRSDKPENRDRRFDKPEGRDRRFDKPESRDRRSDKPEGRDRRSDKPNKPFNKERRSDRAENKYDKPFDKRFDKAENKDKYNEKAYGRDRRNDKFDKERYSDKAENREKYSDKAHSKERHSDKFENKNKAGKEKSTLQKTIEKEKRIAPKKNKKSKKNKEQEMIVTEDNKKQEEDEIKIIQIGNKITVSELAKKAGKSVAKFVMKLMDMGIMANANQEIDFDAASKVCEDFDIIVEEAEEIDILEEEFKEEEDDPKDMKERPPVVVVMGHVDHGKTSLLDAIRHSRITENEAGGITQHIGAYTVSIDDKPITFLDTPGHEAFTAMRMRGAQVTDIAVLVVAADDGVMPQTIEAINHAKAAEVEIIVAINKIDKESANPDRVKQELTEYGLLAEDWGGQTICVPVSAATKEGIDRLLEMIILVSEMKELKANPSKKARGTIIEAQLDKGKGPVATVLVQKGTLKVGDPVVAGSSYGRVRAMMNDKGINVKKAGPSVPVEILGLSEVPSAGDMFYVARNEKHARQVAESVAAKGRESMLKDTPKVSLDDLFNQIQAGNMKELNIVIKADVQGSVEAVRTSLEKLSNEEVRIKTIHGGVGAITESDVMLASASNAIIIGFNVRPEASAKSVADDQKVDLRLYRVIYNAIDDIRSAMKGMLDPVFEEKIIGHAEIRQLFKVSKAGTIGGSYVLDGKVQRNSKVRIIRDGKVVYEGELSTLKRFKDEVKEVSAGYECGMLFSRFNDIKEGDVVEAYVMEEIPQ